jgi:hypothetical protein
MTNAPASRDPRPAPAFRRHADLSGLISLGSGWLPEASGQRMHPQKTRVTFPHPRSPAISETCKSGLCCAAPHDLSAGPVRARVIMGELN